MSLRRIFKLLCLIVVIGLLMSSCSTTTNLKDIIIVEGMAIDTTENENIEITIQMLNVAKSASNGEAPTGNMTENINNTGKSITDTLALMTKKISKNLFFNHTKLVAFGKELAESGLDEHLDYFLRSTDTRGDVAVCISDNKASKLIESKENDSRVPCENILYLIQNGEKSAVCSYVTAGLIINLYNDKTSDIYMPVLKGDKDNKSVSTCGIGVFDGDRMTDVLDDKQTNGFLLIKGKADNFVMELEDEKLGKVGIEIMRLRSANSVYTKNSRLIFYTKICGDMVVNEIEKGTATQLKAEDTQRICKEAERVLEDNCRKAYSACKRAKSDSLRVGEYVARDLPKLYEACSDDWKPYFTSSQINADVRISLKKITENTRN